ncbi:MAG: twitching motility two-component system response regulator PilG [Acidobacteriota bacterium]|nr:twitching motility two-component system response regulator PilG [Acidobacteriota bacterium]
MKSFQAQANSIQTQLNANVVAVLHAQSADAAVLLVEDDETLRRYLEIMLRRAGYAVLTASDGLEALKLAYASHVAAVVTDAVMPRLNGHELCRILRTSEEHSTLPLILLSGIARDDAKAAACPHADAQLTKPVRAEELTDCLKRLIARAA